MTIKTLKITKYVTSDGKEFVGYKNKPAAEQHEKFLQNRLEEFSHEFKILDIINIPQTKKILDEYNVIDVSFDYKATAENEVSLHDDFYDDIRELMMNVLFKDAECADDVGSLHEFVEMICRVIDDFGGIGVINQLYNTYK